MTAKEYFNNVRNAIYGRKNLKRNLSDLEAKLPTVGSFDYGKDRVQTSPRNVHEERICDYVDSQAKYMALMQEYTELILEAEERLKQMSRSDYSEILRCLYMGEYRMTYAEVGDQLGYAEATIRNLVSEAYTEFEQLWLEVKMITTIISNNCTGGAVLHELGMEFKSPTINLQILPEDYPRFCVNLSEYMGQELYETRLLLQQDREKLFKMFGGIPDFPIGNVGDVLVCFQHYGTFQEAKEKWNERKAKIDYDHIGYIFHARGEEYKAEAAVFLALDLPNKLCITQDFEIPGSVRMDGEGFEAVNDKLRIVQAYDYRGWVNG